MIHLVTIFLCLSFCCLLVEKKRPMEPYEREMILYPRVCATCFTDDGANLSGCKDCHSIFYCCQEHAPKRHKEWCNDFKSLLSLNLEQSKNGQISCPLPSRILTRYEDLPTSLKVPIAHNSSILANNQQLPLIHV